VNLVNGVFVAKMVSSAVDFFLRRAKAVGWSLEYIGAFWVDCF
jgi:hypothetical protein